MRTGVFLFGGVEMDDAGAGSPNPLDRRSTNAEMWRATEQILEAGVAADRLGYDSFWLTEHHFQHEAYEVVPNGLLLGAILAERAKRIRIGMMFNITPQWHPLRFAEDFATLHNISGGRGILGVGRGTVPRESQVLGSAVGSHDNPDQADADRRNRAMFDEGMQVINLSLNNEQFSFHGEVYDFPPAGIPDRGGFVDKLTLVPRPLHPYETWQAITSPPSLEAVPRSGWGGVFWNKNHVFMRQWWEKFAEFYADEHGEELAPGEKRTLVLTTCVEDTYEEAVESVRPGHDEFWKFLGPYGWSAGYMGDDGKPAPAGLIPTLEQSIEQRTCIVGSPDDVAEHIAGFRDDMGVENLVVFPVMAGDTYAKAEHQMARLAEEVLPQLA
ncbi:MAG: LLM class flavin-dependent oxidoreductase [Actinomycetota bacterium]|jgi:alkanesulfonate monooxygenase SsuD/methylene tetrahydromethanopterin reductase-like flavin-dependent oxidoreductase (luciferase family)|nr:LLM class flavin-dependent oxidoreductase [Actinomycetota bacterium]